MILMTAISQPQTPVCTLNFSLSSTGRSSPRETSSADNSDFTPVPSKLLRYKLWVWHYDKCSFQKINGSVKAIWNRVPSLEKQAGEQYKCVAVSTTWIKRHLGVDHQIAKTPYMAPIVPEFIDDQAEATIIDYFQSALTATSKTTDLGRFRRSWQCGRVSAAKRFPLFKILCFVI
jgi:hypothetical protein